MKFIKKKNSVKNSVCGVSFIDAALNASIVDSSIERNVIPMTMSYLSQVNPILLVLIAGIKEEPLHLGINKTRTLFENGSKYTKQ